MRIAGYEVHPAAELFPLFDELALMRLAEDIKRNGLRVPIVLLDGKVLDGRNRLLACKKAGVEPTFNGIHDSENPWRAVWSLNAERRQIEDKTRLALIGIDMVRGSDEWEAKQARAREKTRQAKSEGGRKAGKGRPSREGPANRDRSEVARELQSAARLAEQIGGVSRATVERALELTRKAPARAEAVKCGEIEGHKALGEVKRQVRNEKLAEIAKGEKPLPVGQTAERYPVIYADPPWRYEHVETESRAIENQYPTMELDAICALDVAALSTPDAILFLWATSPKLAEAMRVVEAWGFTYRTSAVWVKDKIGMGYYFRQRHELLLVATRGAMPTPAPSNRPDSVIHAALGRHSAKPVEVACAIEAMYPGLPKLELFCRSPRAGWSAWGNQAA
jgi:N6-adenosine-specific RNA methylase IME4